MGWGELRNGDLLRAAEEAGFDVLMTADQNLRYQQNLAARKMALLIPPSNHRSVLRPLVPAILCTLATIQPGALYQTQLKTDTFQSPRTEGNRATHRFVSSSLQLSLVLVEIPRP